MKKSSLLLICLLAFNLVFSAVSNAKLTLHFQTNEYTLTEQNLEKLNSFLNGIEMEGDFEFFVTGHTDEEGSNSYNLQLSQKRAESIGNHLIAIGISLEQAILNYKGEYEPLVKTNREESKAENRRVDIIFKKYEFSDVEELMLELRDGNLTVFEFNQQNEQCLLGKNGVHIKVPKNAFVDENGNEISSVQLKLREALTMTDFIEEDLSTMSNGKLLISGGMYQLEAFSKKGNPLKLRDNASLEVSVPNVSIDSTMYVFTSDAGQNWEITEDRPTTSFSRFNSKERPRFLCYNSVGKPAQNFSNWKRPVYKPDLTSKPRKPSEPLHPKKPKKPNPDAYNVTAKWYHISSANKRRTQAANRYKKAMENYEAAMEAFYIACPEYRIECDAYADKLNKFYADLALWELEEKDQKIAFETKYIPEQYASWEAFAQKERDAYSKTYSLWKEERDIELDSCRQEYKIEYKAWKSEDDSLRAIYYEDLERLGIAPTEADQQYLVRQAKMGWINIDRFWKFKGERSDLIVKNDNEKSDEKVIVHFTKVNSCMSLKMEKEAAVLSSFPIGEPAEVFAYKIEDNTILVAQQKVNASKPVLLNYKKVRFSEFRALLESLGNA